MSTAAYTIKLYNALKAATKAGKLHTAFEMADAVPCTRRHAQFTLKKLAECGLAHIAAWQKQPTGFGPRNRQPLALWKYGPGTAAPKPERDHHSVIRARRLQRLKDAYGTRAANAILRSRQEHGTSMLMMEGELAYKRGKPRGKYLRNAAASGATT